MTFTPETTKFKVICQRCGKTGEIDFDKPQLECDFALMNGEIYTVGMFAKLNFEYYLCLDCYHSDDEEDGRQPR